MRLAQFIRLAKREILAESLAYATSIPALKGMSSQALEDRLPWVLDAIAHDLDQPQSRTQSIDKSRGLAPPPEAETAAQTHGVQRARMGLDIEQVVAEYRVLRSSVLRLWADAHEPDLHVAEDTMRFNEAIDQAVAESVSFHAAELARWRDIFLAVLGHDLRSPISALLLTAEVLIRETSGQAQALSISMLRSSRRMASLLDSLLEYNKAALGVGMALRLEHVDLAAHCREEVEMLRLAFPHRVINYRVRGDATGSFDVSRVREALANLISNAAQHSPRGVPIDVLIEGTDTTVEVSTENAAAPIPPDVLNALFEPLQRRAPDERMPRSGGNLGLGLFIV